MFEKLLGKILLTTPVVSAAQTSSSALFNHDAVNWSNWAVTIALAVAVLFLRRFISQLDKLRDANAKLFTRLSIIDTRCEDMHTPGGRRPYDPRVDLRQEP